MSKSFTVNGLILNADKTTLMKSDLKYLQNESCQFFYKDKLIKEVIHRKFLGSQINQHINW